MQSDAFLDVIQNTQKENIQMDLVVKQFNPEDTGAFYDQNLLNPIF